MIDVFDFGHLYMAKQQPAPLQSMQIMCGEAGGPCSLDHAFGFTDMGKKLWNENLVGDLTCLLVLEAG